VGFHGSAVELDTPFPSVQHLDTPPSETQVQKRLVWLAWCVESESRWKSEAKTRAGRVIGAVPIDVWARPPGRRPTTAGAGRSFSFSSHHHPNAARHRYLIYSPKYFSYSASNF
jgi:hypothetical protein